MKVQVHLTDKDYFDFNVFQNLRSHYGARVIKKTRILLAVIFGGIIAVGFLLDGFSTDVLVRAGVNVAVCILFQIFLKRFFVETVKANIKQLKKQGKLAYHEYAEMEFLEHSFIERTPDNKTEQSYASIERISVVEGRYIYIHPNNLSAYILPVNSFKNQAEYDEFLSFIKSVCPNVDFYKN